MEIKVGDIVFWYESGNTGKKQGQVLDIKNGIASVYCDAELKNYFVEVSRLRAI